jgi:hypothetical protein
MYCHAFIGREYTRTPCAAPSDAVPQKKIAARQPKSPSGVVYRVNIGLNAPANYLPQSPPQWQSSQPHASHVQSTHVPSEQPHSSHWQLSPQQQPADRAALAPLAIADSPTPVVATRASADFRNVERNMSISFEGEATASRGSQIRSKQTQRLLSHGRVVRAVRKRGLTQSNDPHAQECVSSKAAVEMRRAVGELPKPGRGLGCVEAVGICREHGRRGEGMVDMHGRCSDSGGCRSLEAKARVARFVFAARPTRALPAGGAATGVAALAALRATTRVGCRRLVQP